MLSHLLDFDFNTYLIAMDSNVKNCKYNELLTVFLTFQFWVQLFWAMPQLGVINVHVIPHGLIL